MLMVMDDGQLFVAWMMGARFDIALKELTRAGSLSKPLTEAPLKEL